MWSYDPAQLSASPTYQVRLLIGDTLLKDPQLQDEEIAFLLTLRASIWGAAAECCRSLAAQMSRQADSTQGALHTLYSSKARAYGAMATRFDAASMTRSAGLPYGGGLSQFDMDQVAHDPDRVAPQFAIGMDDSHLPVAPLAPSAADVS